MTRRSCLSRLERGFRARLRETRFAAAGHEPARGRSLRRLPLAGHRLTVELDSYKFHKTRHAWEQDRERDRDARRRGDQLRRYTWRDVFEEPDQMLTELHELLHGSTSPRLIA